MAKGGRSRSFGGFVAGMPRSSVAHLRIVGKELQHLADIVQRHLRQVGFRGRAGAGMFDGIGMDLDRYIYNVCVKVCALGQTKLDLLFRPRLLSKTLRSLLSFNSSWSTSSHSRMLTACCTTQVFSRWKPLENPGKVWPKKSSRLLSLVVETLSHRHLNTQIGFNIHNYSLFLITQHRLKGQQPPQGRCRGRQSPPWRYPNFSLSGPKSPRSKKYENSMSH